MISQRLYSDELIGRREELQFLTEEFRAASHAGVRLVTIEGEAGIGKSRLLHEFFAGIEKRAGTVAGHCREEIRAPYLPFTEVVEYLDPRSRLAALRPREHGSYSEEKWEYFNAVADVVRSACTRRPLALALEDAQWADSASVELLNFLVQRLRGVPCLLIVTLRSEPFAERTSAAVLRSAASRAGASLIHLRGLSRNDVRHLVQACLAKQGVRLDPAMLAQIEVLCEGNALFAEELARTALENGTIAFNREVPVTLGAILAERLLPFSEVERGLLHRAALIGPAFDATFLASLCSCSEAQVLEVMQRAVARGLVYELEEKPAHFTFRHALIRRVLSDQLVIALAAPLHVRIAQALEDRAEAGEHAAELAYHWSAARVAGKARIWNQAAAQSAWDVYAYRDAIRFYTDALRWEYPPGSARALVYERLGVLLYTEGCGEEPSQWFARAYDEYASCGNDIGAAHALLLQADQSWVDARTQDSVRAALQSALQLKQLGHSQMYCQALLTVARFSVTLGQLDRALAHLQAVSALSEHFDAGSRAAWHEVRGETYAVLGRTHASQQDFRAAARLAAQTGISELISQIENNFALAAFDLGEFDLAAARHQIAVDEALRSGLLWRIAYCSINYARTLMYKGDLNRARQFAREAIEAGVTTATFKTKAAAVGIPLALALNDRALLAACADESALQAAEQSGEIQRIASVAAAFAQLRLAQDDVAQARALLTRALHAIPHAHRAWELLIAVARWGEENEIELARSLLSSAVGRPRLKRAHRLLFEALIRVRFGSADASRTARIAADQFARMGNAFYSAIALEAAGQKKTATPACGPAAGGLTARQREIAALAACGETNKGIASRLSISEHTVEHHLSEVFARLGLRSRTQLALLLSKEGSI
ncbi:MAG TPA: AAA family ATPase [Candidatus Baltobacteraceae bacterium]|jgi:DNA-binding CsgD family transcriptional regulator|nr:AAA family ATPase [Candidatus Baltobacteraceae bacterium]